MVTNQENESVPAITSEKRPPDTDPVPPYHRDASSRRAELEPVSGHCRVFRVPSAGCLPTSRASASLEFGACTPWAFGSAGLVAKWEARQ
jgi:hypothetical protein